MNNTFNLLFYVKKSKTNSQGQSPIYMRITIDGKICEISTKRLILTARWNSQSQKVSGSTEESRSLNFYLKSLEQKVYDAYHQMLREQETPTCKTIKINYLAKMAAKGL